jgi:NitT/TauT family transport system substrate-binding protein
MQLSTEHNGGVGAEEAMLSGQVDMSGAWYVHTIEFQQLGKDVIDIVQLSGAPGEREMCTTGSNIKTPGDWKDKVLGVTDVGSGTDNLTLYLAARHDLTSKDFTRVGVGAGPTMIGALKHNRITCGMTTQPTVNAIEKMHLGYSAIDLATGEGVKKWLGGYLPSASVLARADWVKAHPMETQAVVNAMVATMRWISTHSAADIADKLPKDFVSNALSTRQEYIDALEKDKGQFLPDGMMPKGGPETVLKIDQAVGKITKPVNLETTYTNVYAIKANAMLDAEAKTN